MTTGKNLNLGGKLKPGPQPMDLLGSLGKISILPATLHDEGLDLGGILKPGGAHRIIRGEPGRITAGGLGPHQGAPDLGGKLKPGRSDKFTFVPSAHRNGARGL